MNATLYDRRTRLHCIIYVAQRQHIRGYTVYEALAPLRHICTEQYI